MSRWRGQPPHQSDQRFGVVNVQADAQSNGGESFGGN